MLTLDLAGNALRVLCIGAHADDIEIGCGGTVMELLSSSTQIAIEWCVLSAEGQRRSEAESSAADFLRGAGSVEIQNFRDAYFPYEGAAIKTWFETLRRRSQPDLILTHSRRDLHQDHRMVGELTWNTFRDHLILEYETPKWDGDLGIPNCFVPVSEAHLERKIELLMTHSGSQRSRAWFDPGVFRGLARLRGMECRSPTRYAEAFYARKLIIDWKGRLGPSGT
jgi:LmbE family N-acetylglucosaminyl deacetylase